jgi:hypothetical protein
MVSFNKPRIVRDRIRGDFGGGGGGGGGGAAGDPVDAIVAIRQRLGESFLRVEPSWQANLARALSEAEALHPRGGGESAEEHAQRLRKRVLEGKPAFVQELERRVRLFAFVLGRPDNKVVKDEILPRLDYWHHRSGTAVDFVCLGFSERSDETPDGRAFAQIVRMLERHFSWKYSGETDLLVFNGRYDTLSGQAVFDLTQGVALTLERALEAKAISSVGALMEDLFRVTEAHRGDNPAWAFSDSQGLRIAGSGLKNLLLAFLPNWARDDVAKGLHFHVRDLGPRAPHR